MEKFPGYNRLSFLSIIYGLGQRIGRIGPNSADSTKQIYHNDHLGNVRAITKRNGDIVTTIDYYPFGEQLQLTGQPSRFSFNDKEYDDSYGFDLYYYGARYMSPSLGRFVTPDPMKSFLNPYSYVNNNPINMIDPTGMTSLPAFPGPDWHWEDNRVDEATSGPSVDEQIGAATASSNFQNQYERALNAILESQQIARKMAANSSTQEWIDYWNGVAEGLKTIVENGNWSWTDLPIKNGAAFSAENKTMYINQKYLNDDYKDYLIGSILHEGAHYAYDIDQGNFAIASAKANGKTEAQAPEIYGPWHANSEAYAWKGTITYYDQYKPQHTANTDKGLVSGINDLLWKYNNDFKRNMTRTLDYYLKLAYPQYHFWWRP
jgi:RHS repeat-associated protein